MSMTKGTPASSQIISLERMVANCDAEIERLRALILKVSELHVAHVRGLNETHEARIKEYGDEIERLRADVEQTKSVCETAVEDFNRMKARAEKAEAALRFYSDPSDYKAPMTAGGGKLYFDCGKTAREALAQQEPVCPHCGRSPKPGDGCAHAAQQDCLARRQQ